MEYPLFGIIYNWKGLKEENYLYTAEELKQFDEELYNDCMNGLLLEWHDSTKAECAWKTWMGFMIIGDDDLKMFLTGVFNEVDRLCLEDDNEDWYWENSRINDLYGHASPTMVNALSELKLEV